MPLKSRWSLLGERWHRWWWSSITWALRHPDVIVADWMRARLGSNEIGEFRANLWVPVFRRLLPIDGVATSENALMVREDGFAWECCTGTELGTVEIPWNSLSASPRRGGTLHVVR